MECVLLDRNFIDVGIVDVFEELLWADRYSAFGDFEIYTPVDRAMLDIAKMSYYLWNRDSEHTMIVEERTIKTDLELGNRLLIQGRSLESILTYFIVWNQTVLSGNFQNAIKKLLDEAIINPSDPNRRISNFIFQASTDPRITSLTVQAQFTGDNLYDAIKGLCDDRQLGFKVVLNSSNQFVFSLYSGTDRSYKQTTNPYVIFSPSFDNIINSNYFESQRNVKTIALVAGEGEGAARRKISVNASTGGPGVGLNRRELFVDARDISSDVQDRTLTDAEYNALLTQRGSEKLAEHIFIQSFESEIESSQNFIFGRDFFMGDIVQITNEYGIEGSSRISEIIMSQNTEGHAIVPTFITV